MVQSLQCPPEMPPVSSERSTVRNRPLTAFAWRAPTLISLSEISTIFCPLAALPDVSMDPLTIFDRVILTLVVAMVRSPLMVLASMTVPGAVMVIGPV